MATKKRELSRSSWWFLAGFSLALLALAIVFWGAVGKYASLVAPDSMPYFHFPFITRYWDKILLRGMFTPQDLYWLLLNPLYAHELTYLFDSLILILGARFYLRTQGAHPLAAWFGGIALGLCGYTFTLFSAGHRGYFHMFSGFIWAFGLIARGFQTHRLIYFAWLGAIVAWGVLHQPDVAILASGIVGLYVLWLTCTFQRDSLPGLSCAQIVGKNVKSVWLRFLVSIAAMICIGYGGIYQAATKHLSERDAQIASTTPGVTANSDNTTDVQAEQDKLARWIFATNWSLPPEDMLEFIIPGIFGNDSMQPPYPYWGRLGQPHKSQFQKGRMMPNYRQHTVYMGVITLIFAVFALLARLPGFKSQNTNPTSASSLPVSVSLHDIPFWGVIALIGLLLAMGRYTPLYRVFYALPYMDYIRAPVKFLHFTEIAVALLAGLGMDVYLRTASTKMRRSLLWVALGFAGALVVAALSLMVSRTAIVTHIIALGINGEAESLAAYALQNTGRSLLFAVIVAGVCYTASHRSRWVVGLGSVILLLLTVDQVMVARRYVRTIDVEPLYRNHVVADMLKQQCPQHLPLIINYLPPNAVGSEWFKTSLSLHGIKNMMPGQGDLNTPLMELFVKLQQQPLQLWQKLGIDGVILPLKGAQPMLKEGVLQPLLFFEVGHNSVRKVEYPSEQTLVLASVRGITPGVQLLYDWQDSVPLDQQVNTTANTVKDVSDAPLPQTGKTIDPTQSVKVVSVRNTPGCLTTAVEVSISSPGLLVFRDQERKNLELFTDGARVSSYTVNGIYPAALLSAGTHQVALRRKRLILPLAGSMITNLLLLSVTLITLVPSIIGTIKRKAA